VNVRKRERWSTLLAAALLVWLGTPRVRADDYYVAVDGSDSAAGNQGAPFASLSRAQQAAKPGDTVFLRGGTYKFVNASDADAVLLDKSGQADKPISYFAYTAEHPVLDFSGMSAQARITGLRVTGSYIHIKGLELKGVPQNISTEHESWGIYNTGSHNTYELLDIHNIMGPGLFLAKGGDNLVLNCDSHHNYDPKSSSGAGTNADGFGCHTNTGATNNVFRGCRAWFNSDDGFDFIQAQEPVLVEGSWAFSNGYLPDTTMASGGDGNGFKAGGYGVPAMNVPANPPSHTVRQCVAWQNRSSGFYSNHHPAPGKFYNNSGYKNAAANFNTLGLNGGVGILRNNVALGGTALSNGSGDEKNNSWNPGVTISEADFESVSTMGLDGPRDANGNLPQLGFMRLRAGSDLIDKGSDVGLPYAGAAPDLGAYEFGASPTGNTAGAGGASGTAGATAPVTAGSGASGVGAAATAGTGGAAAGTQARPPAANGGSAASPTSNSAGRSSSVTAGQAAPPITTTPSAGSSATASTPEQPAANGCKCSAALGSRRIYGRSSGLAFACALLGWLRLRSNRCRSSNRRR
jgi:hypothetical protein